jgi:hypothetical protein
VVANLDSRPRQEGKQQLAGYGFLVSQPGLMAANLQTLAGHDFGKEGISFVSERNGRRTDVWVYGRPGEEVAIVLPLAVAGPIKLASDGGQEVQVTTTGDVRQFRLPDRSPEGEPLASQVRYLWHAVGPGMK